MAVIEPQNESNQQYASRLAKAIENQEKVVAEGQKKIEEAAAAAKIDPKTGKSTN